MAAALLRKTAAKMRRTTDACMTGKKTDVAMARDAR